MKLLQCIQDSPYIIWQLYVQMLNFREHDVEKDAIILCMGEKPSPAMQRFMDWTHAAVYFFPDTRITKDYFSSFRPNLIKQYMREYNDELKVFFYHDSDIIFLKEPELDHLAAGPMNYVAAEAGGYVSAAYVKSFQNHTHLQDMCYIVGIDPELVAHMDELHAVGGAQYVLKETSYSFWDKVEQDCEKIYRYLKKSTMDEEITGTYHIQIWCADLWAVLYNLWLHGDTRQAAEIDFCWPWEPPRKATLHNAGITSSNDSEGGKQRYFNKHHFTGDQHPFHVSHDYVSKDIAQYQYISYFKKARYLIQRMKILGILCTNNKVNSSILTSVVSRIFTAQLHCAYDVEVVTSVWEHIPANPFEEMRTPFRGLGHLNYILQLKEVLLTHEADIVCILEHDVLYPECYFDMIGDNWDFKKYGIWNLNYIGVNGEGYQNVRELHAPMSMLSVAKFYIEDLLNKKLNDCVRRIHELDGGGARYGWVCIEPDNKADFKLLPPDSSYPPCVHINMNRTKDNHHFTRHSEVCYEPQANARHHRYWGDFTLFMPEPFIIHE